MNPASATAEPSPRRAGLLVAGSGLLAVYVGFLYFAPAQCEELVRRCGYWWMLLLCLGWAAALSAVVAEGGGAARCLRRLWPGWRHAAVILIAWLWLVRVDPPGYKVLYDEPVLATTSFTAHTDREIATTVRAYPINGLFTVLKAYLDKRPPLFPFLVTTVHDLTGYRVTNAFAVNIAGTLLLLLVVWHLGRRYGGGPGGGAVAVGLLATVPTLGINATSGSMDLMNLALLAVLWTAAVLYLEQPGPARAALLVCSTVVLAYCRYESVLFVGAAGVVWAVAAWRARLWLAAPVWAVLPLALVLYAWHNTVLSNTPYLWELRPDQTQRFSFAYAPNNLVHAANFLFKWSWTMPNSPLLAGAGVVGGLVLLVQWLRRRTVQPLAQTAALAALGGVVLVNLALLICYYWGELDDPIVSRLSLPVFLLCVVLAVAGWRELQAWRPWGWSAPWSWPGLAVAGVLLAVTLPSVARERYSAQNLIRRNFEWERRVAARLWPAPGLVITNRSPICWLAEGVPSVEFDRARARAPYLRWHLARHSFGPVLVMQRILVRGRDGGWAVDPKDATPPGWHLEEIAVRRIGLTLTRISRVVAIDPPAESGSTPPPAASGTEEQRS